ncbi:MAG: hypothetical protein R3E39_24935 [Anaerolineae bacterium]
MGIISDLSTPISPIIPAPPQSLQLSLCDQANLNIKGTAALMAFMAQPGKAQTGRVASLSEKEADSIRRALIDDLNRSFVTY